MKFLALTLLLVSTTTFAAGKKPIAVAKATPSSGYLPLTINLDGSGSYDPDGQITSHTWKFPDNSVMSGQIVTYTFKSGKKKQKIDLRVEDNEGKAETDKVQIEILDDNTNPSLSLDIPDSQTVFIDTPTITAFYSDTPSQVDLNKIQIYLDSVNVTSHAAISDTHAVLQFTKNWPLTPGEHFLRFVVSDYYGNSTSKSATIKYVRQEISANYLNGRVIDKDGIPVAGANVFSVVAPVGSPLSGITRADGTFSLPFTTGGDYQIKVSKDGYVETFKYKTLITDFDDNLGDIYVAIADTKQTFVSSAAGGVATNSTDSIKLVIPPGSLDMDRNLNFTEAQTGKTLAVPLPNGSQFTYAQNNQPSGTTFTTPADMSIKNIIGFPAGTEIPVGVTDEQLGVWVDTGFKGVVSEDETMVDFKVSHFSDYDVNLNTNSPPGQNQQASDPEKTKEMGNPPNPDCPECKGSRINSVSNDLLLDYEFPSVMRRGKNIKLGMTYSSLGVTPKVLLAARNKQQFNVTSPDKIQMVTNFFGQQKTKTYEKKLSSGAATFVQQFDMVSPEGYPYQTVTSSFWINLRSFFGYRYYAQTPYFGGPAGNIIASRGKSEAGFMTREEVWLEENINDRTIFINNTYSKFGAGWTLNGLEKLSVADYDGTVTFEDGTGHAAYFVRGPILPGKRLIQKRVGTDFSDLHYSKGFFYGTSCENNDVFRIDLKGRYTSLLSNEKNSKANLNCPTSIHESRRGGFYIADSGNRRVIYLGKDGKIKTVAGHNDKSRLTNPTFVTEDNVLAVHIVDGNEVKTISTQDGSLLNLISEDSEYYKFKLKKPTQVHFDNNYNFVVLDQERGQIIKFYINGGYSRVILDKVKGITGMTFDPILRRYYLYNNKGEVFAWDGVGDQRLIPIDLKTGGLLRNENKNAKKITSFGFSPEIGLVYGTEAGLHLTDVTSKTNEIQTYIPSLNEFSQLQKLADGTYVRTLQDKTVVKYDSEGKIQERIFTDGSKFIYEYDLDSKLLQKVHIPGGGFYSFVYYGFGLLNKVIDPAGRVTELFYDSNSNVIEIKNPEGDSQHFSYDSNHLVKSHSYESGGTNFYTHRLGRVSSVTLPDGKVKEIKNTLIDALFASSNENGEYPIMFSANAKTEIISPENRTVGFLLDTFGMYAGIVDGDGNRNYVERNADSKPTEQTSSEGRKNLSTFDSLGRMLTNVDHNGETVFTYLDNSDRISSVRDSNYHTTSFGYTPEGLLQWINNPKGYFVAFNRNADGTIRDVTDNAGSSTKYERDEFGNVVSVTDSLGQKTSMSRDLAGNLISSTDPLGNSSSFLYDSMNRISEILDAKNGKTSFNYTPVGDLATVTDAEGHQTNFSYNENNLVTKITNHNGQEVSFTYDGDENVLSKTTKANQTIGYTYNGNNQLVSKQLPEETINFEFDKDSLLVKAIDADSQIVMDYDTYSRLTLEKASHYNGELRFSYNKTGKIGQSTLILGNANAITSVRTYDQNGALAENTTYFFGKKVSFRKVLDNQSRVTQLIYPNGASSSYNYDANSRVVDMSTNIPGFHYMDYRYTANGNISIVYEEIQQISRSNRYSYDEINRLVKEESIKTQNFIYDGVGNNTSEGGVFNELNQLTEDNSFIYTYDLNGNQTEKRNKSTGQYQKFTWNSENQLQNVKVHKADNSLELTVAYKYDPQGRRFYRSVTNHVDASKSYTRKFVYEGNSIIAVLNENNEFISGYMYDDGIDEPVALVTDYNQDGELDVLSIVRDRQNSVKLLVNEKQEIVQEVSYSAYGETKIFNRGQFKPVLNNNFYYTSRELEPELGIYYYRARYYDPRIQRFLSEDPIGIIEGDENRYRFVYNNPSKNSDPFGLDFKICERNINGNNWNAGNLVVHRYVEFDDGSTVSVGKNREGTFGYIDESKEDQSSRKCGKMIKSTKHEDKLMKKWADKNLNQNYNVLSNSCKDFTRDMLYNFQEAEMYK